MSSHTNQTPAQPQPHKLYLDRRTGHYLQVIGTRILRRTYLLDEVEACSSKKKEEREPLMKYFRGILETKRRFYHPPPAGLEGKSELDSSASLVKGKSRQGNQSQVQSENENQDSGQGSGRDVVQKGTRSPTSDPFQDQSQTLIQDLSLTQTPDQDCAQIQIVGQIHFPTQISKQDPTPSQVSKPIERLIPPNQRISNLSSTLQIPTNQQPATTARSLKTFPKFPLLPTELQLQIWTSSLPGPRIFECTSTGIEFLNRPHDVLTSHRPLLSLLRACKTSNRLIDKRYTSIRIIMLGWDFPIEYCEQPHYLVDFEKDVFYFPNADVRVLGRAGGRVRNLALSVAEIGFCGVPGTVGGDVLVPRWVVGGKVSDEESVRQREEFHGMQRTFRHWDQDYEDTETHVDTEPAHEEKFLKSLTLVGDGERVLLGMEAKFGVGAERDFEHSYWEWVGGDLPLPVERTSLDEEPDHPYWKLYRKRLDNVQGALESEPVRQAYEGIGVKFELWRRPRQEGFWRKTARG